MDRCYWLISNIFVAGQRVDLGPQSRVNLTQIGDACRLCSRLLR